MTTKCRVSATLASRPAVCVAPTPGGGLLQQAAGRPVRRPRPQSCKPSQNSAQLQPSLREPPRWGGGSGRRAFRKRRARPSPREGGTPRLEMRASATRVLFRWDQSHLFCSDGIDTISTNIRFELVGFRKNAAMKKGVRHSLYTRACGTSSCPAWPRRRHRIWTRGRFRPWKWTSAARRLSSGGPGGRRSPGEGAIGFSLGAPLSAHAGRMRIQSAE